MEAAIWIITGVLTGACLFAGWALWYLRKEIFR